MITKTYNQLSSLRQAYKEHDRQQYSDRKRQEYQAKKATKQTRQVTR